MNILQVKTKAFTDEGYIINSSFLNHLKTPDEAILKAIEYLEKIIWERKK